MSRKRPRTRIGLHSVSSNPNWHGQKKEKEALSSGTGVEGVGARARRRAASWPDRDREKEETGEAQAYARRTSERRINQDFTASATTFANSFISSSVVSNEHIQRTIHSSSIH